MRKATDTQIAEWADRHGIQLSPKDLRPAFEDAQTLTEESEQPAPAEAVQQPTNFQDVLKDKICAGDFGIPKEFAKRAENFAAFKASQAAAIQEGMVLVPPRSKVPCRRTAGAGE